MHTLCGFCNICFRELGNSISLACRRGVALAAYELDIDPDRIRISPRQRRKRSFLTGIPFVLGRKGCIGSIGINSPDMGGTAFAIVRLRHMTDMTSGSDI